MSRLSILLFVLAGCVGPVGAPDLSLHDRFVLTALTDDAGDPVDHLRKWSWPLRVVYWGPDKYRDAVFQQAIELGEIAGQPVEFTPWTEANFYVEISDRDTPNTCQFSFLGSMREFGADIHIWSEQPERNIYQCISQELSQVLGPRGDLDTWYGSRQDTVFASYGGALQLTEADRQVFRVLFDERLRSGMPRAAVLAILPEIVADVEAEMEQEVGR